jgi:5-methylcytosine-specific restriction endonuclease McrA
MSGGKSSAAPIHQPSKPPDESAYQKPKRVESKPSGGKEYYYDCAGCGTEFSRPRHRPSQKKYCGDDCRNKAFGAIGTARKGQTRTSKERRNISKGQRESWADSKRKKKRLEKSKGAKRRGPDKKKRASKARNYSYQCTGCGKRFSTKRKRTGKERFCTTDCRNKWQSSKKKGEDVECANPNCDKKFYQKASRKDRKYCSKECADADPARWKRMGDTRRERYGRDWEWTGWNEKRTDRNIWDPIAAAVRKRDGYKCQACGVKWHRNEKKFPVHHILPRKKGGPDEPWNLMTLCPSCHRKTDAQGGPVRYPFESQTKLPGFLDND